MLRVELHCHTRASIDGLITPDGLVHAAQLQGLDAVAITDHDTIEGAVDFAAWFRRKSAGVQILIGEERTLDNGFHLIGLFLKEAIQSSTLADVIAEIHDQNGLVLMPHPCRKKDGLMGPNGVPVESLTGVDAVEIHNAKGSAADNASARYLSNRHSWTAFGGSDAHYEADVGQCVNEISQQGDLEESVRAMLLGHTPYRVLASPQPADAGERRYAPTYYAIRKFAQPPRFILPVFKQLYRVYWNLRHGGKVHPLKEIKNHLG